MLALKSTPRDETIRRNVTVINVDEKKGAFNNTDLYWDGIQWRSNVIGSIHIVPEPEKKEKEPEVPSDFFG